jgi:uncharacterized protein YcfJ
MNEWLPSWLAGIQCLQAMMTHRNAPRIRQESPGMNRNATAAIALPLVLAATYGAWRVGWNGPLYARVLSVTPVTVSEPRYVDVVDAVPVPASDGGKAPGAWDVAYRQGERVLRTRTATEPGDQIRIGEQRRVIGFDVVWRWRERTGVARLSRRPGKHLPVVDGAVVEAPRASPPAG